MKPLIVNADYDDVLNGSPGDLRRIVTVECVALWVLREPVRAHRAYPEEYLDHIQQHTGHRPVLKTKGPGENWWGELKNLPLERELNSKLTSFDFWNARWPMGEKVCRSISEVAKVIETMGPAVIKRAHGMSGRGVARTDAQDWQKTPHRLHSWVGEGVIVGPLLGRVSDLSALWLPQENQFIFYRNDVDQRFQWRGVELENGGAPNLSSEEIKAMGSWRQHLEELRLLIQSKGYLGPFSIDAFFYKEKGILKFHPGSEINARKTMGFLARELWKLGPSSSCRLWLEPRKLSEAEWKDEVSSSPQDRWLLSPAHAPFVWRWKFCLSHSRACSGLTKT